MGLIHGLERSAARHAHVLVVETPGHWQTRAAVERAVLARGWHLAFSPADADVLAVCGRPGPHVDDAVERVWQQMPGPRVRVDIRQAGDVAVHLDEAHAVLLDTARHRDDADSRPTVPPDLSADNESDDHGEMDHGEMDHGEMDHGDMDHGDMDMAPGGIPLAEGGEDRDGLEMDVLHVRLGPVLAHWPAGLVLRCALQGDVITGAEADLLDDAVTSGVPNENTSTTVRARWMDSLVDFLALAGWDDAAAQARRVRDDLLEGGPDGGASVALARLVRRVRRSRVLRWSLRDIRPLTEADLRRRGLPIHLAGDTYDRLLRMLDGVATAGAGDSFAVHRIPELVTGLDVATARLVVASLGLHDLTSDNADNYGASHG